MRALLILILTLHAAAQTPSVETARAATPKETPIGDVTLQDGERQLRGALKLAGESLHFCCHSFGDASAKAVAKCPYSFTIAAAQVKEQYLTTDSENPKWHLVTKSDRHFEFDAPAKVMSKGFDNLKKSFPDVVSKTVKSLAVSDAWRSPSIATTDPCRDAH